MRHRVTWLAILWMSLPAGMAQTMPEVRRDLRLERIENSPGFERQGKLWGVVIGVSRYKNVPPQAQLRFAHRDAEAFAAFLQTPNGGGFPSSNLKILLEENATLSAIRTALGTWVARSAEPADVVYLYFAGHGVTEGEREGYLLGYDSDPQDLYATALSISELDKIVTERIRARTVVLLVDACHAGHLGWASRGPGEHALISRYMGEVGQRGHGVFRLLASRADERSYEGEQWGGGHGAFTYFLLEGLRGKADRDKDGVVRATEVIEFLSETVAAETKALQHPRAAGHLDPSMPLSVVGTASPVAPVAMAALEVRGPAGGEVYMDNAYHGRIRPSGILVVANLPTGPHELSIDVPGGGRVSQRLVLTAAKTILNVKTAVPERILAPHASLAGKLYEAVKSGRILEAGGAWESYQRLVREDAGDPQRKAIEAELGASLAGIGQRAINDYVRLPPAELRPDMFHRAALAFRYLKALEPNETQLDAKRLFCEGRALIVDRNPARAIDMLRRATSLDPKAAYSYNALGLAYEALNQDEEAIRAFQTATQLAPSWTLPHLHLGMQYQRRRKMDAAEREFRLAVELSPQQAFVRESLVVYYRIRGRYPEAEKEVRQIIDRNPAYAPAYRELGLVYQASGRYRSAADALDTYLKMAANAADADSVRGLAARNRQLAERKPPTLRR